MPTATKTPTVVPTKTQTQAPTAKPTKKPVTAPPAGGSESGGSTPVTWKNETSHVVRLIASGAGNYSLTLQPQEEKMVYWDPGIYRVVYYLDGGSTIAGTDYFEVKAEVRNLLVLNFRY